MDAALLVGLGFVIAGALVALLFRPSRPAHLSPSRRPTLHPPMGGTLIDPSAITPSTPTLSSGVAWVDAETTTASHLHASKTRERL